MSKYKLVPVELTEKMTFAGIEVYGIEECADADVHSIWEAMLTAAPEVQVEVVGWQFYEDGKWWNGDDRIKGYKRNTQEAGFRIRDVYAAPQPEFGRCGQTDKCDDDCDAVVIGEHRAAEQKPSVDDSPTPVSDVLFAAEFNAWWEQYGQFCRAGGGDYERTFAFEAWRHLYPQLRSLQMAAAEQKPAPAEALRQYQNNDGSGLVFGYDKLLVDQYIAGLEEALETLQAECEKLRKDAERYRWLRDGNNEENSEAVAIAVYSYGDKWDEMIDDAMEPRK